MMYSSNYLSEAVPLPRIRQTGRLLPVQVPVSRLRQLDEDLSAGVDVQVLATGELERVLWNFPHRSTNK